MSTPSPIDYGLLRWSECGQYKPLASLALGEFERKRGTEATSEATLDLLSRRSTWLILRLYRLIGRPMVDILVARAGEELVGTGMTLWLPHVAYVTTVATRPEVRGRGIASRILAMQAEEAQRRKRPWLALDVEGDNETAQRVYRKAAYQDAGTFTWFTRNGLPPQEGPPNPPAPRLVERSDYTEVLSKLDASRPADYRSAFPAGERTLHHNEYLVRGGRLEQRTWRVDSSSGGIGVVRAYYLRGGQLGVYFPMTTNPEISPEDVLGMIDTATEWLRSRGPSRCLAMVSEPGRAVTTALERRGFSSAVSSLTMLRKVSG